MSRLLVLHWRDRFNKAATTNLYVEDEANIEEDEDLDGLYSAFQEVSACALIRAASHQYELFTPSIPALVAGQPFRSIEDKGHLELLTSEGNKIVIDYPGPKLNTIAVSDAEALDSDNATIDTIVANIILFCTTRLGEALLTLWRAYRSRSRTREPQNLLTA